jgi:hypothetical protein
MEVEDGEYVQAMGFDELFDHHCRAVICLIKTTMSENTLHSEDFLDYLQGFDRRAKTQ